MRSRVVPVVLVATVDDGERPAQGGHHGAGDQRVRVRPGVGRWVCAERGGKVVDGTGDCRGEQMTMSYPES